jgi:hypothetical protein
MNSCTNSKLQNNNCKHKENEIIRFEEFLVARKEIITNLNCSQRKLGRSSVSLAIMFSWLTLHISFNFLVRFIKNIEVSLVWWDISSQPPGYGQAHYACLPHFHQETKNKCKN